MDPGVLVSATIVCVDCGGTCHLVAEPEPQEGWRPGDVAVYRCEDCSDRWDVVVEDPAFDEPLVEDPVIDDPSAR